MEAPLWARWARVWLTGAGITGFGVVLYKFTTPTDEQLIARMSPEVRTQYEREKSLRRKEQEELMRIVKKTSASDDPIWMTGPLKSPLEARADQMKERERRERELAAEEQQEELAKIKRQIDEAQRAAKLENEKYVEEKQNQKQKSGWLGWGSK